MKFYNNRYTYDKYHQIESSELYRKVIRNWNIFGLSTPLNGQLDESRLYAYYDNTNHIIEFCHIFMEIIGCTHSINDPLFSPPKKGHIILDFHRSFKILRARKTPNFPSFYAYKVMGKYTIKKMIPKLGILKVKNFKLDMRWKYEIL